MLVVGFLWWGFCGGVHNIIIIIYVMQGFANRDLPVSPATAAIASSGIDSRKLQC